jgi:hypothetical protein
LRADQWDADTLKVEATLEDRTGEEASPNRRTLFGEEVEGAQPDGRAAVGAHRSDV